MEQVALEEFYGIFSRTGGYFGAKEINGNIVIHNKRPMFNLSLQDYRSLVWVMIEETPAMLKTKDKVILPKAIFKNSVFKGTEFDQFHAKHTKTDIPAKNLKLQIRVGRRITQLSHTNVELRYIGVKYSGMVAGNSYIGNTIGVPILKTNKILKPDQTTERQILSKLTRKNLHSYQGYEAKNILDLMSEFDCSVWYQRSNTSEKEFFRYFDIRQAIQNNQSKSELDKIIKKFKKMKNKNVSYLVMDDYFVKISELNKYFNEIINILLGKDIKEFNEHHKKAESVSKTKILPDFNNKTKDMFGAPFEHQKLGISWLFNLYQKEVPGAILADDMGMGKTYQTIGFLTAVNNTKRLRRIVIVCPASVISVWQQEIKQFNKKLESKIEIYSFEAFSNRKDEKKVDILIIDEAQRAKNKDTRANEKLRSINSDFTLLLTGTPIENKVQDIYNIMAIIDPIYFKIYNTLAGLSPSENNLAVKTQALLQPVYLRRIKTKQQLKATLQIEEIEIPMYKFEQEAHDAILNFYGNKTIQSKAKKGIEYYNDMIIALGRLRQVASYSYQLKDLIFMKDINIEPKASKSKKLLEMVNAQPKEKFVIFSMFTETIKHLEKMLPEKPLVITGAVSSNKRGDIIKEFQEGPKRFIIVSLKAGNSGITLHAAKNIVMYDLWWNPAVMMQAISRAYRIGQTRDVTAYMLVNKGSIDENIIRVINLKKEIIAAFDGKTSGNESNIVNKLAQDIFK